MAAASARLRDAVARLRRHGWALLPLAAVVWLASGVYSVQPDESAVATFLGRVVGRDVPPGVHWSAPWPLGRVTVERTATNFTMPVGFRLLERPGIEPISDLWLTGDTNIVAGRLTLQYRIRSLTDFRLTHEIPRELLRRAGERVLTRALVRQGVDEILTSGRSTLREAVQWGVQELLDEEGAGIDVQSVAIEELAPPRPGGVRAAFQEVQNARSDRERSIHEASAYRAQVVAEAEGASGRLLADAKADRYRRIELARGEAQRFSALAAEHARAPGVTEQRLYLESLERVLPAVQTYVVEPGADGSVHLRVVQ